MLEHAEPWDEGELDLINAGKADVPPESSLGSVFSALGLDPVQSLPSAEGETGAATEAPVPPSSGIFARPAVLAGAGAVVVLALALIPTWPTLFGNKSVKHATERSTAPVAQEEVPSSAEVSPDLDSLKKVPVKEATSDDQGAAALPAPSQQSKKTAPTRSGDNSKTRAEKSKRPSLAEELALLKKARGLMASGYWSAAQAALNEHKKRFVPARLSAEARVIRVEILLKTGKRAAANRAAAPLMRKNSPYRARMETLLSSQ